jgi:DNA mismatch repair protein MutL
MTIRQLSSLLVSQIAAGEVVQRPSSVVKELVENAFDSGATRIEIDIEGGGRDLVRILDDGEGISRADLPLAVAPHATSKIFELGDLDAIQTMGFRGEALASIASVSRLAITSRTSGNEEGWRIEASGEDVSEATPAASPPGTAIDVRTLFFNTPARRRFLKSDRAETTRVSEQVRSLALSRPGVALKLRSEGRTLLDFPRVDSPAARVAAVLGEESEATLLEVHGEAGDVSEPSTYISVWGLVGRPETARPTQRQQRFVINGRTFIDRSLSHALKEAFRGLIEPGKFPVAALFLEVDPRTVDVNVHPAKTEVRFRESRPLFALIKRSIEQAFVGEDLMPSIVFPQTIRDAKAETTPGFQAPATFPGTASPSSHGASPGMNFSPTFRGWPTPGASASLGTDGAESAMEPNSFGATPLPQIRESQDVLQVHSSFLVTQDQEGLVVIDQHALHERVMFEKLKARIESGSLQSQQLTTPAMASMDPEVVAAIESLAPLLEQLGMDVRPAGLRSVAIHAFPTLLFERKVDPVTFVEEILERAAGGEINHEDREAALSEVLDMMSCKAAIKAGDRLSAREITELLEMRDRIDRGSNCPHGRPTHLRIPIEEIERRFGRSPSRNRR